MNTRLSLLALVFCATTPAMPALAQSVAARRDSSPASPHWCFRGRPRPVCRGFWLTEFGVASRVSSGRAYESGPLFTWDVGLMGNSGGRHALGATLFAQAGEEVAGGGIRPRLRTWLNRSTSLDVAPGILLVIPEHRTPGFSGSVALNFGDYAAITAHVVRIPPQLYETDQRIRTSAFVGGRLGSAPGAVTGVGFPVVVIVALMIACGNGQCFD